MTTSSAASRPASLAGRPQPGRTPRADLPLVVDRASETPLASQIIGQLRDAVTSGVLLAGERLPSTRDLAATLGVSRTVITMAYAQLFAEGWLEGRQGSGTYIANVTPGLPAASAPAHAPSPRPGPSPRHGPSPRPGPSSHSGNSRFHPHRVVSNRVLPESMGGAAGAGTGARAEAGAGFPGREVIDLQPGIPWAAGIDPAMWRRAWRYAGTRPPSFWPDPHGLPELRAELASYLRRSRGLAVTSDHVLVTRGVSSGLTLLAGTIVRPGDKVGVEEPGYPAAREVLRRAGAEVVPCPVDENGVIPGELPPGLRLLYVTPAHQYPMGARLPVARRQALTAWARATGAVIVEDDYDGEFRYDVAPLPALYSMEPGVVVYLGTTSKTLSPVLGTGWLVASPDLIIRLAERRTDVSDRTPEPAQHALLDLLTSGDLEKHVRRMRLEYARRRAVLVEALSPHARLQGDTAGMHIVAELPSRLPAGTVAAAAADLGVAVFTLDRYYSGPVTMNGLILGYGATPLTKVRRAATTLATLLSAPSA